MGEIITLNGKWKFRLDPKNLGEKYPEDLVRTYKRECRYMNSDYDDTDWDEIKVPSCWQTQGYNYNGVAWYRRKFTLPTKQVDKIYRLKFKGVDYFADVWINRFYLGSHEGFFNDFEYDITERIRKGENLFAVKVESPNDVNVIDEEKHERKTLIKGALQDWDVNNLSVNPGGIYKDVFLEVSNFIYLKNVKVDSLLNKNKDQAKVCLRFTVVNQFLEYKNCEVRIKIKPKNFEGGEIYTTLNLTLRPGESEKEVFVNIKDPKLWWTWDLGEPNLYHVEVEIRINGEIYDSISAGFGIRSIERKKRSWETYLNGKRIFFRGTNYLSDQFLSNMNMEKYKRDIQLIKEANMNTIRTFCIVEKEEFYQLCDEAGIMVYQDFPMQWRMNNSSDLVRRAMPQVKDMVNQLYNHPSIVIWCLGSEPGKKNFEKLGIALAYEVKKLDKFRIVQQANAYPEQWDYKEWKDKYGWCIDNHLYYGWYKTDFWPSLEAINDIDKIELEFIGEYGAQALPDKESLEKFIPKKDLWPMNLKRYNFHCFQDKEQFTWIKMPESLEELIDKSQKYQAYFLKYHTEFYRRYKFNPCNGALQFVFNDCWPAITWSIVDYYRKKKPGYYALKQAFSPIHVIMEWPDKVNPGGKFKKKIYVVNDYHYRFDVLRISYTVSCDEKIIKRESINCDIGENTLKEIGYVEFQFNSKDESKEISVALELWKENNLLSRNNYRFTINSTIIHNTT